MSRYSKVLYLAAILVLGWLAAVPYWPAIRQEVSNFYATWQAIRNTGSQDTDTASAEVAEESNIRERSIAQPKTAGELPVPAAIASAAAGLDPFLAEARKRAQDDPEAAMQWLQEQSVGAERLRGMLEVVALWAAKDSESTLLWLESNAQGLARLETLNSGVELWAQRDPQAAAGWIDGMANDGSKITAAKSLASTWVKNNPVEASAWVTQLPYGAIRNEAASALALSWMETDPVAAADWAYEESRQTTNPQLYIDAIRGFAGIDPEQAESFIRNRPTADPINPNYINEFIEARAESDPLATAEWIQQLPSSDPLYRTNNTEYLARAWTKTDSIAASAWLSEQPLGPERDAAIVGFAETIQNFEPEAAATWANTISDGEQRSRLLTSSVRTWAHTQPREALEWVINSDLEPALQEQLAREIGVD